MILARLLTPEDFGLFAIAMAIHAVVITLVDFGLPAFLIQKDKLEQTELGQASGLSLLLAVSTVLLILTLIWLLPSLFPNGVTELLLLLMGSLMLRPFIMPIETALARNLKFKLLSGITVVRALVATTTGIALGVLGFGAQALAAGVLLEFIIATLVLMSIAGRDHWSAPRTSGWTDFFSFGLRYSSQASLAKLSNLGITGSISTLLGVAAMGQLDRARSIINIFDQSVFEGVAPAVLPAMSHALRSGSSAKQVFLTKTGHLTAICWPAFALLALFAQPLVLTILGDQWHNSVEAVRWLALAGLFYPFSKLSMKLFVALNMSSQLLKIQLIYQPVRVLLVALAATISLEVACIAISVSYGIKAVMVSICLQTKTGYVPTDLLKIAARGLLLTLGTVAMPMVVLEFVTDVSRLSLLAVCAPLAVLGWFTTAFIYGEALLKDMRAALSFNESDVEQTK